MERARVTSTDSFFKLEQNSLDQLKKEISALVTQPSGQVWSYSELASFLFSIYQMGENDWKLFALEEPGDYNRRKAP